jgi:hypothetical protein
VRDNGGVVVHSQTIPCTQIPHGIGHRPHGPMSEGNAVHMQLSTVACGHLDP